MDVRTKQLLCYLACPLNSELRVGNFAPRHLSRYAFSRKIKLIFLLRDKSMKLIKMNIVSIIKSVGLSAVFVVANFCAFSVDSVKAQGQKAKTEISGRILGGDGKPMEKAFVALSDGSYLKTLAVAEADQEGNFRLTTEKTGLFLIHFNGVNHLTQSAVLMVEKPRKVTVNAKLFVAEYKEDLSEAIVFSEKVKPGTPGTNFKKQSDGTYVAEFETQEKSVYYTITRAFKIRGFIQGTQKSNFKLHESGILIFKEAIPVEGKVRIVLDPTKLPRSSSAAEVSFGNPESVDAKLYAIYREIESRKPQQQQSAPIPTSEEISKLVERINNEKNLLLKKALWLNYLHLTLPVNKADSAMVIKALDAITPASPLWILGYDFIDKAVTAANQPVKYKDYVETVINRFPNDIKVGTFGTIFNDAFNAKQMDKAQNYLVRLSKEYPDSPMTKHARYVMDKDKKVVAGKNVPTFTAYSFDNPKVVYTNSNIKAKVYLIDFWATWCAPCLGEMPKLHKAYEKFRNKGFEILSYSFDSNREVVSNFRKRKDTPMPWLHAIDPQLREMNDEIAKQFEIFGIPAVFLVDSNGKILATHFDLGGDNLEKILTEMLGEAKSKKP